MEEPRRERSGARELPADDLRADVRYLGSLLGTVLREQGGDGLLAAVEQARTRAIELRDTDDVVTGRPVHPDPRPRSGACAVRRAGVRQLLPHHQHPGAGAPPALVAGALAGEPRRAAARVDRRGRRPNTGRSLAGRAPGVPGERLRHAHLHRPPDRVAPTRRARPPRTTGRAGPSRRRRPADPRGARVARGPHPGGDHAALADRGGPAAPPDRPRRGPVGAEHRRAEPVLGDAGAPRRADADARRSLSEGQRTRCPPPGGPLLGRRRPRRQPERHARGDPPDDRPTPDAGAHGLPPPRRPACPGSQRRVDAGAGDPRPGRLAPDRRRRASRDRRRARAARLDRAVPPEARVHRGAAAADDRDGLGPRRRAAGHLRQRRRADRGPGAGARELAPGAGRPPRRRRPGRPPCQRPDVRVPLRGAGDSPAQREARAGPDGDPGGDGRRSGLLGAPRGRARDAPDRASGPGPAAAGQLCPALVGHAARRWRRSASSARSRSAWAATPAPPTSSR